MPTIEQSRARAKDDRLQAHKQDERTYVVYNVVKGTSYNVLKSASGTWCCTCPFATKGSHIRPGTCKHLQRVLDKEAACQECQAPGHGKLVDSKCASCRFYDRLNKAKIK